VDPVEGVEDRDDGAEQECREGGPEQAEPPVQQERGATIAREYVMG
jgi:hypothetical protein